MCCNICRLSNCTLSFLRARLGHAEIVGMGYFHAGKCYTSGENFSEFCLKRQKKLFIDFLRNRRGQTTVAPYSLRLIIDATVSTPLDWSEVKKGLDPIKFNLDTIFKRIQKKGDLWANFFSTPANLKKLLKILWL